MVLQQFPNLAWLKQQISRRFADRRGPAGLLLESDGFPSVVIHAKAKQVARPDVQGPLSLFINLKGESICTIDGRRIVVGEDAYCISNNRQLYTLEIGNATTETFNIHIGERFAEKLLQGYTSASHALLSNHDAAAQPVNFYNNLYRRDARFNKLITALASLEGDSAFDKMLFEETLAQLQLYLLQQHNNILQSIANMPPAKPSVKEELYKRLALAADYMQAYFTHNIQLEDIAAAACLSKFHFLRLFKQAYHLSPYQYIQQLRMEKACRHLNETNESVADIAALLGYENSNSFSRIFKQRLGVYPSQYKN